MDNAQVIKRSPSIAPPEHGYDARAHAWAFVFECWHAKKGDPHALTNGSTKNWTTGPDMKGTENADIHGN